MKENCNDELLTNNHHFSIEYSVNIKNIDTFIPEEFKHEFLSYVFYMAKGLNVGDHEITWNFKTDVINCAIVNMHVEKVMNISNMTVKSQIDSFIKEVFIKEGIDICYIKDRSRLREKVITRQICMYLLVKLTRLSLSQIGYLFNKDHSTVLHAKKTIQDLIDTDKEMKNKVDDIELNIASRYFNINTKS